MNMPLNKYKDKVLTPYGFCNFKGIKKSIIPYHFIVYFDDNTTLKGSESHQVQLHQGSFWEISQLSEGDKLMGGKTVTNVECIGEPLEVYDILDIDNDGNSYYASGIVNHNCAFIEGIDKIYTSIKPTIATGGGIIALSSPNGVGNWFHKMYTEAEINKNDFKAIKLPWNLHPDRIAPIDAGWEERERVNMSVREFAQEYDCDFLGSSNSVIEPSTLSFYEQTYIQDPVERRFMGGDYWIWQYPDYSKSYIVCLPPGEKVLTDNGIKDIECVDYNDKLIDKNGDYTDVLDIKRRYYDGDIYEIQPLGTVRTTKFTDEHPILISPHISKEIWFKNSHNKYRRKQVLDLKFDFIDAKDVKTGDWIKYPNIYIKNTKTEEEILEYYKPYLNIGRIDFQNTDEQCILSEDFWWFVGIWLAEGGIYENKEGNVSVYTGHNSNEVYIHDRIENIITNLFKGKTTHTKKESNTIEIEFNNKGLGSFLINTFNKKAKNKNLPEWIKYLPNNLKVSLIQGYLEGDGCSSTTIKGTTLNFVSISLKLLEDIQEILFSLGICSNINNLKKHNRREIIKNKEYIHQASYSLIIDRGGVNNFIKLVPEKYKNNPKLCKINNLKHARKLNKGCFLSENIEYIYFKINSITKHKYSGVVCNFTTSNTNTFLCKNITTHNCADVSRGDGADFSAFHVIDVENCEQVAEYKSQVDTRTYGNMLVSVATEYNNALLVVENANIGWDVINTIIEKGYQNLHYSPRAYGELSIDKWVSKIDSGQTVPGFTTSTKTRPLVISKMEAYIRDRHFTFHSKRLLEELRVFIWQNGKAQAQSGYNDDLVMALGIGLFTRDTGVKFHIQGMEATKAAISGISVTKGNMGPMMPSNFHNPYQMENIYGEVEDLTWVL